MGKNTRPGKSNFIVAENDLVIIGAETPEGFGLVLDCFQDDLIEGTVIKTQIA